MSLKIKIPIIVSILIMLNLVFVIIYNKLYFFNQLTKAIYQYSGIKIDASTIQKNPIILERVILEAVIITIILITITISVYYIYVHPLLVLKEKVNKYEKNIIEYTDRKDEIGQLQNSFSKISKNLLAEKLAQNRMIASISHDIKTPLTSVLGYTEKLLKMELPMERSHQYLEIVYNSALDIKNITTEFDEYINGKVLSNINKQNIKISYLAKMLEDEYSDCGLNFTVENLCGEKAEMEMDLPKIRRVFANIIGNSIKHNRIIDCLRITVTLEYKNDSYIFTIVDNGKGVPPESMQYIFEPFFTTENREGISGLGLSICRDIVENHGGCVMAENLPEGGFKICCIFNSPLNFF